MPAAVAGLERRPPWADAVEHYARMIAAALPQARRALEWLAREVRAGLAGSRPGTSPRTATSTRGRCTSRTAP